MAKLSAAEQVARGKELAPARLLAFELWKENPQITGAELDTALKEKGFDIHKTTRTTWLSRFRKGKGVRAYEGKPLITVKPEKIVPVVKPGKLTLEQIIEAVDSVEALSLLFYQGVMEELKRRDAAFDVLKQDCLEKDALISQLKHELGEVTKERNRIMREWNEKIAGLKIGTLTLDQVEHRLIPKEK